MEYLGLRSVPEKKVSLSLKKYIIILLQQVKCQSINSDINCILNILMYLKSAFSIVVYSMNIFINSQNKKKIHIYYYISTISK